MTHEDALLIFKVLDNINVSLMIMVLLLVFHTVFTGMK